MAAARAVLSQDRRSRSLDGGLQRAIALEPNSPATMFNLAGVYALEGNTDSAFALLARVRCVAQLRHDAARGRLRVREPALRSALPAAASHFAADFAEPFVENVKVLSRFDGDSAGDQFGWIARDMGDVDHDGDRTTS